MKAFYKQDNKASYLDVTEFILKECSPLMKASSPKLIFNDQKYQKTPQINPIDHDPSKFIMTPLCTGLCDSQQIDLIQQFSLQSLQGFILQAKPEIRLKHNKSKQNRQKNSNQILQLFQNYDELNIICQHAQFQDQYNFQNQENNESQYYSEYSFSDSQAFYKQLDGQQQNQKPQEIDLSTPLFNEAIQRYKQNPKKEIIKQIKQIQNTMPQQPQQNKKQMIKKFIEKYLLEFQTYCYEQSWKQLEKYGLSEMIKKIIQGLNETFSKKIGQLPFQIRRTKILKYLEKKKKRIWRKKVSYDCRKKVADGRLRIKGKFVTRQQACQQLGVVTLQGYTSQEIKYMLQRRLELREFEA